MWCKQDIADLLAAAALLLALQEARTCQEGTEPSQLQLTAVL
jgi:hypothetical protein